MPGLKKSGDRMLDIVIVGAGGFGREVYHWARPLFESHNYRFKGLIDDKPSPKDASEDYLKVLGTIRSGENQYKITETDRFVYAIGNIDIRKEILTELKGNGAEFITLIHPTAIIAETARIGEGVVVCPFALISDRAIISDFAMINFYASCAHDSVVGKYSILSPYATMNGHSELEEEVLLGTHATVTAQAKIGAGSKINANSVAMNSVPPNSFVYGVPGKHMRIFSK
jgi:sugar O-acyltransferase (sialic acid O-acetyltransferase NeuD family)